VDSREAEVPIREANSVWLSPDRSTASRISAATAAPCRFPAGRCDPGARNVITDERGDKPVTEEGDAAVAIKFDGWAVVR
jgi:hypothetical protein